MCGKTGKVFYKMGNLGDKSSTSGLGFENRWSHASLVGSAECVGVNVCINSFLIMYYHCCQCVLLLTLLCPFTDRLLSEAGIITAAVAEGNSRVWGVI